MNARSNVISWIVLLGVLLRAGLVVAAAAPKFDARTMMPVSEIRRGMKGIGKSVFQGTKIETFDVEILGVLKNADLGGDIILVRILNGVPVERQTGPIEGMSGSPIYIDGRLVGALAWGWTFAKEPILGITPIRQMLESLQKAQVRPPATPEAQPAAAVLHKQEITRAAVANVSEPGAPPFIDKNTILLRPLGTLLSCSGFTVGGLRQVTRVFGQRGLTVAPGGGQMQGVDTDLAPGAAVGVQLMTGDFDMTAVGTVTYRDGDSVIAFGHPMMQLGDVDLPLTTAYVHDIIPSLLSSMKMTSPLAIHGRLLEDRTWSVGGQVGQMPELVPLTIRVRDGDRGVEKTFHVQVAQQEELTPDLVMTAVVNAVEAVYKPFGEGTVRTSFTITTKEGQRVHRSDIIYDPAAAPAAAMREFADALGIVAFNSYEKVHLSSIEFETEIQQRNNSAEIKRVYVDKPMLKRGESTDLHVILKPFEGELVEKRIKLKIPADTSPGIIRVVVSGGSTAQYLTGRYGVLRPIPQNLEQEIKEFESTERGDALVISASLPEIGIAVEGRKLERLPPSVASIMAFSQSSDMVIGRGELKKVVPTDYVVQGAAVVTLRVYEKGAKVPSGIGLPSPPQAGAGPPEGGGSAGEAPGSDGQEVASGLGRLPSSLADFTWDFSRIRYRWRGQTITPPLPPDMPPRLRKLMEDAAAAANAGDDGKTAKDKTKSEEKSKKQGEEKTATPVARQPSTWTQDEAKDFLAGELDNMAVIGTGKLTLAPAVKKIYTAKDSCLWALTAGDNGVLYAGSGNSGRIIKIVPGGESSILAETGEVAVLSLVTGRDGMLYAGTGPDGKILQVTPDGKVSLVYDSPESYIWAMTFDDKGRLYAATGSHGVVYRFTPEGKGFAPPEVLCDLSSPHALSLALGQNGLFVGTGDDGIVYRVSDRNVEAIYDSEDDLTINTLVADANGNVYAGTSPGGRIIKIAPDGAVQVLYENSAKQVLCMWRAPDGRIYAGTGDDSRLLRIEADDKVSTLWDADEAQILGLAGGPGGTLYVSTANMGAVYAVNPNGVEEGEFKSSVCDAGRVAKWGTVSWRGVVPKNTEMQIQTRTGNTSEPDSTWSAWSAPLTQSSIGCASGNPPGRYLQYRVKMKRTTDAASPELERFSVVYLPANQKPTLKVSKPKAGATIGKKCKFEWQAKDPDKDTLRTTLFRSSDGGKTWKPIKDDIAESSYEWDTSGLKEGVYTLKIQVSDEVSNPGDARTEEVVLPDITLDNSPPDVLLTGKPAVSKDGRVTVRGSVMDARSPVVSVQYRIGKKDAPRAAAPGDGIFDSTYEQFEFTTKRLEQGEHTLYVEARDAAQNLGTKTLSIVIKKGKRKTQPEQAGAKHNAERHAADGT